MSDDAKAAVLDLDARIERLWPLLTRREGDGLHLPWTGQKKAGGHE